MISFPNAKINIGLSVIAKRTDGFHNIESIFYPINWCDVLEIIPAKKTSFISSGIKIVGKIEDNLCLKAYELLREEFNIGPVAIHLKKNIPIGAGIGGGSADAAFTLKMLNEIFELSLSPNQLEDRAKLLGSDCAFFIQNKPMVATEKGDIFQETKLNLNGSYILLINPNIHVSTQTAYSQLPVKPSTTDYTKVTSLENQQLHNDFEDGVFSKYPEIEKLKLALEEMAIYTSMTGSGSTVFGIFNEKPEISEFKFIKKNYITHLERIS